jgi:hypothetical protein
LDRGGPDQRDYGVLVPLRLRGSAAGIADALLMIMAVLRGDLLFDQRQLVTGGLQGGRDAPTREAQSMSACHDSYQLCSRRCTASAHGVSSRHASAIPN